MKKSISQIIAAGLALSVPLLPAAELHVPGDHSTIQAAINAAFSGDTIRIAPGDYFEQIVIGDNLTLVGEPGAIIHATTSMAQTLTSQGDPDSSIPLVGIVRSEVVLTGLTFDGERLGAAFGSRQLRGLYFLGGGGRIENCTVRNFRGTTLGNALGLKSYNPVTLGTPVVNIAVSNCTFENNTWGIHLRGDPSDNPTLLRTTVTIEDNTITGIGPTIATIPNGIFIRNGVSGDIRRNVISGHSFISTNNAWAAGISGLDGQYPTRGFVPLLPIRYDGNTFSNNDQHLMLIGADASEVVSNVFYATSTGVRRWGSVALSGANVTVANNDFSDVPIGIELFGGEGLAGVQMSLANGTRILTNRFCRVAQPLRVQPLVTQVQEQGTELCTNLPPARELQVPSEYASIQAAVNAASWGDTIRIAAGDYFEQVVIANHRLTLVGEPGAVIYATAGMRQTLQPYGWLFFPLMGIYRSDVVLSGLAFEGEQWANRYSILIGVYYVGASGLVTNCSLRGFRGPTATSYAAAALRTQNAVSIGTSMVDVGVFNSTFENNELSMHIRGEPGLNPALLRTTFVIEGNTVTGVGPSEAPFDGIAIRNGAAGVLRGNTISSHIYTGTADGYAAGIAAFDDNARGRTPVPSYVPLQPIRCEGNTFRNNDEHVLFIGANDSLIANNIFEGMGLSPRWGTLALSGTNIIVANNNFADLATGILLFGNDAFVGGWPAIRPATNPRLSANWFCNVGQPLSPRPGVTGLQDAGTQFCPFRPRFQPLDLDTSAGLALLNVRTWHGLSVVIQSSDNLRDWTPIYTNDPTPPTFEYRDATVIGAPRRFYRAVQR